uniref:Uncharacterized protein n=1 Tax=Stomoxys calcitrans TaxID=35570 RepID=A0A1I8P9S7_STOCA
MQGLFSKTKVLMVVVHIAALASSKPMEEVPPSAICLYKHICAPQRMGDTQPTYEYQLIVWPTDLDDFADVIDEPVQNDKPVTIVKDPVVVMPTLDDDYEENGEDVGVVVDTATPIVDIQGPSDNVRIMQNYHKTYANGSAEYMLVLSNGLVNYQRIDLKKVDSELLPVQNGYYTVPLEGDPISFQTTYYHADENGYHVHKTELSTRNPTHDLKLDENQDWSMNGQYI